MPTSSDIIKVVLHWIGYGEEGTLSCYFQSAGSHSDALLANAAGNINTVMGSSTTPSTWSDLASLLTPQQQFDSITVYQYDTLPGTVTAQGEHGVTGQVGSGTLQGGLQDAVVVTTLTDEAGKSKRGRMYLPAHCVIKNTLTACLGNGQAARIAGIAGALLNDWADALASTLDASDPLSPVVYSPTHGYVTPITALRADNKTDTQRRRAFSLEPSETVTVPFSASS